MKKFLLIALLALSINSFSQTGSVISIDAGSNITSGTRNSHAALMYGLINFKNDHVTLGPLVKKYNSVYNLGMRISVSISLSDRFFFYTLSDAFAKDLGDETQLRSARLELGAGVGVRFLKSLQFSAGVQSEDWDPYLKYNNEGSMVTRLTYNYSFKKELR